MTFIKTPVKGMPEYLPSDMEIREFALRQIKDSYKQFGFSLIETPAIEHIENLTGKQGGENEKLIFRILKRGEKLSRSEGVDDMCDSGLRYDLTVPLARYFSNNMAVLPYPFKALQIGPSWRADKPQKGRFRQFTQCDIDIIGDGSNLAEIELITATSEMLTKLGLEDFVVRVNDRRILKAMAMFCGFNDTLLDDVFIALDKLDKIGSSGVESILLSMDLSKESVEKYMSLFSSGSLYDSCSEYLGNKFNSFLSKDIIDNLEEIIISTRSIISKGRVVFDPTLVRGMSYYTGPIFEIELIDKSSMSLSIAGGGRYDNMIGNYTGKIQAPACGFSIGFERIASLLKENASLIHNNNKSIAFLISENITRKDKLSVFSRAKELRSKEFRVLIAPRLKNLKLQINQLVEQGFYDIYEFSNNGERKIQIKE